MEREEQVEDLVNVQPEGAQQQPGGGQAHNAAPAEQSTTAAKKPVAKKANKSRKGKEPATARSSADGGPDGEDPGEQEGEGDGGDNGDDGEYGEEENHDGLAEEELPVNPIASPVQTAILFNLMAIARMLTLIIKLLYEIRDNPTRSRPGSRRGSVSKKASDAKSPSRTTNAGASAAVTDDNVLNAIAAFAEGGPFWDAVKPLYDAWVADGHKSYVTRAKHVAPVAKDFFKHVEETFADDHEQEALLDTLKHLNLDLRTTQYLELGKRYRADDKAKKEAVKKAREAAEAEEVEDEPAASAAGPSKRMTRRMARQVSKSSDVGPEASQQSVANRARRAGQDLRFREEDDALVVEGDEEGDALVIRDDEEEDDY
ncbi:uncharacterized protein B0I36DRAFT_434435 [Microdochium trichocladiopsis]|uniref:Uncharacterized protein n=1 Tax=Microdochium trichocladiopsis TaxID=1682393 RepID=A0A9P8XXW9_9PEZI|nr:uncharacterized protein B0I36DRAFT_434435 [Microdochium trichocladiopsis]KAH7024843.1 hypothetical protein B0I36DRAFT_434435 [Microdochium trichocladiopsis]